MQLKTRAPRYWLVHIVVTPFLKKEKRQAQQSTKRAVQWVRGGNYGTPVPRDYSKKQNRKERKLALKTALTEKANDKELVVVENITLTTPKTKEMIALLKTLKLEDKKVLIIVKEFDENIILASRNLQNVVLISADEVNVLDLVATNMVLITEDALKAIEEVLA